MKIKKLLLGSVAFLQILSISAKDLKTELVDKNATKETFNLFKNMKRSMSSGIMLGHQDDAAYGRNWYNEKGRSDVKDVAGDYPAVVGWELGNLELGADRNLDSVYFGNMKRLIREVYERGGVNTISWHANNLGSGKSSWDCSQDTIVRSILNGGVNHSKYLSYLDQVAHFLNDLKTKEGKPIPVIFRMFHEHTGAWFWWGAKQCTPEEYNELFRLSVSYLRDKKNVHNVLYAFSTAEVTDKKQFLDRYPGDEWVDIVGFDTYCFDQPGQLEQYKINVSKGLDVVTKYAKQHNKIPIFAETGQEGIVIKDYFTKVLLPLIKPHQISYVLLWRNAFDIEKHYYVPYPTHTEAQDFIKFTKDSKIILSKKSQMMKLYK